MKRLLLFLAATQLSFGAMDLPFQEIYDEVAREVNDLARAWVKPEYQPLIEMSQAQNSNYMNAHTFEFWFHFKNTQGVRETKYLGSFTGETIAQIHNGDIPAMVRHLITAVFFGKRGVRDLLRLKPEMQSPNHPKMGSAPRPKPLFREPVDPAEIEKHLGPYTEHGGFYYRAETYSGIVRWLEKN